MGCDMPPGVFFHEESNGNVSGFQNGMEVCVLKNTYDFTRYGIDISPLPDLV